MKNRNAREPHGRKAKKSGGSSNKGSNFRGRGRRKQHTSTGAPRDSSAMNLRSA